MIAIVRRVALPLLIATACTSPEPHPGSPISADYTLRSIDGAAPPVTVQFDRGWDATLRTYEMVLSPAGYWTDNIGYTLPTSALQVGRSADGTYTSDRQTVVLSSRLAWEPTRSATLSSNGDTLSFFQSFADGTRHRFVLAK